MDKVKRLLVSLTAILTMFGVIEATPVLAAPRSITTTKNVPQQYASTPAFQPCYFTATMVQSPPGKFIVYPGFDGCIANGTKFMVVRIRKSGIWISTQLNFPSVTGIGFFYGGKSAPCVNGLHYTMEVLFFIRAASFQSNSGDLICDGTA